MNFLKTLTSFTLASISVLISFDLSFAQLAPPTECGSGLVRTAYWTGYNHGWGGRLRQNTFRGKAAECYELGYNIGQIESPPKPIYIP